VDGAVNAEVCREMLEPPQLRPVSDDVKGSIVSICRSPGSQQDIESHPFAEAADGQNGPLLVRESELLSCLGLFSWIKVLEVHPRPYDMNPTGEDSEVVDDDSSEGIGQNNDLIRSSVHRKLDILA
jgi:hypothetical protein